MALLARIEPPADLTVAEWECVDPIDLLRDEHIHFRKICDMLDRMANNLQHDSAVRETAIIYHAFTHHFPLHQANEEEDFFPLLRARCLPEDGVEDMLTLLLRDHTAKDAEGGDVDFLPGLLQIATGRQIEDPMTFIRSVLAFTEMLRRHIAWEDATLMRLARRRLTAADRSALAHAMMRRRLAFAPAADPAVQN
jgi:hemerythrin-like domain-containing protein